MRKRPVVVVGGGLSGLAAAVFLARQGLAVTVLEKGAEVGGRARTRTSRGYAFNLGPHALFPRSRALLRELGVPFTAHVPPGGHMVREGRRHTLPYGPLSLLATGLLTLGGRLEAVRFLAGLSRVDTQALDGVTLADFLQAEIGREEVRQMLRVFARVATYADDPLRTSAGASLDQLRSVAQGGVLYLDGGWQTLVDGLVRQARAEGVTVERRSPVAALERDGARLADGRRVAADAFVLAVDPATASRLVPESRALARAAAEAVPVRAASLDLALERLPRPDALFALAFDRPVYYSVHSASARLAPAGGAVLHAMTYLPAGRESDASSVERELEAFVEDMQPGYERAVVVRRFLPGLVVSNALVTAAGGGLRGRPPVALADRSGVFLAGDWVGPEGQLADASLSSARAAAAAAAQALAPRRAA
jgi:phytoene dehydrogenase-like protein